MYRREFLTQDRNKDLYENYKRVISMEKSIVLPDVLRKTVESPAKRFYISSDRVYGVLVRWKKKGEIIKLITEERQEMYEEIYRRVLELEKSMPDLPLLHVIEIIIEQPAPKFYITPKSADVILCKHKSILRKQRQFVRSSQSQRCTASLQK